MTETEIGSFSDNAKLKEKQINDLSFGETGSPSSNQAVPFSLMTETEIASLSENAKLKET